MKHKYTIVHKASGLELCKRSDGRWTVLERRGDQVYSYMAGDMPCGGGAWSAPATDGGRSDVSSGYCESYAKRVFKAAVWHRRAMATG